MPSTKTSVSQETISVLDDQYRYDSSAEVANAKWLDLSNVMSVKRDKTIYAIRARNSYDFTGNNNTQFFANTISEYRFETTPSGDFESGTQFTSDIYRGFGSSRENGVANNIFEVLVYGNVATRNVSDIGVGGSLENGFTYGQFGNVNVQSNVVIYGNLNDSNASGLGLPRAFSSNINGNVLSIATPDGTTANVNSNATCFQRVQYNDSTINQWNRLINANINGSSYVNASTDPCDFQGAAVNNELSTEPGSVASNEAFRHQFQLRKNGNIASQNPIYVARISRFGQRLSDNKGGVLAANLAIQHFSSNFFASIPSDNCIYAGGNLIDSINITGNISSPLLYVFNSNFRSGQLYPEGAVGGNFNGVVTSTLSSPNNNSAFLTITQNRTIPETDAIRKNRDLIDDNRNINDTGSFQTGDRFGFTQADVFLDQGFMLMDRIAFKTTDNTFVGASTVFSQPDDDNNSLPQNGNLTTNYNSLWFSCNMWSSSSSTPETSSKYLILKGANIQDNNWQTVSLMTPSSLAMPLISGRPNLQYYTIGNTINTYLRRGNLSMKNYTYVDNKTLSNVNYISTVPGFINNVILSSGNISLSRNVLEDGRDLIDTATTQINLPLLAGAQSTVRANISCNYSILFSGNVNVENRVDKSLDNVVNNVNSFIANAWNYDQNGLPVNGAGSAEVFSNVSIIYGNTSPIIPGAPVIRGLQLNSPLSYENITYDLEFVRVTGQSDAPTVLTNENYVYYPNLNSTGNPPSTTDTNISTSSSVSLLNNNLHINGMNLLGVAYSEYNFISSTTKFTDLSGVLPLVRSPQPNANYNYNYILPTALLQTSNVDLNDLANNFINTNDTHMNITVDYLDRSLPDGTYFHQLTLFNVAYRYEISSIETTNNFVFDNSLLLNDAPFDPSNLYAENNSITPEVDGNLEASTISCYVYENINSTDLFQINQQSDYFFPFTVPRYPTGAIPASNSNALFPAFQYSSGSLPNTRIVYGTRTQADCDLVLPANANANNLTATRSVQIIIQAQDLQNQTFKVSTRDGVGSNRIAIRPMPHGRSSSGALKYATPILCGIEDEPNSYVILMVECISDRPEDGLAGSIIDNAPIRINVSIIPRQNNGKQQLRMNASLRVFNDNNELSPSIVDNFSIETSTCQTCFVNSSQGNLNISAQLAVNIFSVPANGSILSFIYSQDVISRVLTYNRTDYEPALNSEEGYSEVSTIGPRFAYSQTNLDSNSLADGIFPSINANSTRFYLDSRSTGIFVDLSNDSNLNGGTMANLVVGRSVEWVLKRTYGNGNTTEIAGRGLMSKSSNTAAATYYIYENLLPNEASGYLHAINTNVNNLATRCIMQRYQNLPSPIQNGANNKNNWTITTLGDQLNAMIVRINGATGQLFDTNNKNNNITKQASIQLNNSNQIIDLGSLFGGPQFEETFISLLMAPIRGFDFNSFAAAGNLNTTRVSFGLTVQPDSYCLVHLVGGPSGGVNISESNVLFSLENSVRTNYLNDFTLSFANASLAYQYLASTSPLSISNFTLIGNYVYKGFGEVQIYSKEFTSNYDNALDTISAPSNLQQLQPLGNPSSAAWQVDNIAPNAVPTQTVNILFDQSNSKYYFELNGNAGVNQSDRVYFRGVDNLPTTLNNKSSLLLYTGLRPLVLNVLQVNDDNNNSTTLEDCITSARLFNWNNADINNASNTRNIFTSLDPNSVVTSLGAALSNQFYQVVLTNANAPGTFNFRNASYKLSPNWFSPFSINNNENRNFFGSYEIIGDIFSDLRLNIGRTGVGAISTTYDLDSNYFAREFNSQANESDILDGQFGVSNSNNTDYETYIVNGKSNNPQSLGYLFSISVLGNLGEHTAGNGQGFTLEIEPAQMSIYTALDVNNNGEIDNKISTNVYHNAASLSNLFGLENMFSEMNIVLPAVAPNSYRLPTILSSWELTRDFNSVPISGCPFDIRINNRWSVGYNLDCYFAIVLATSAQFDVITVATKAATNNQQLTNLEVQTTAPLMIKQQNDWARSLISAEAQANNFGSLSGLTFKMTNATQNVIAGSIVRLFVDNTIASNIQEWTVTTTSSTNKTYQLYAYDQERYAALLDEQLSITNNFL